MVQLNSNSIRRLFTYLNITSATTIPAFATSGKWPCSPIYLLQKPQSIIRYKVPASLSEKDSERVDPVLSGLVCVPVS